MKRFFSAYVGAISLCMLLQMTVANDQTVTVREINPTHSNIDSTGGRVNYVGRATDSILYAASEFGGLYKSTDAGRSWTRLDAHLPTRVSSVEASPGNPDLVVATSLYDGRVDSLAGINVSHDGGVTWSKPVSTKPPLGFCSNPPNVNEPSAFGIAFDPENVLHIFVGTNCGLAKSTDGGLNWTYINPGPSVLAVNVGDVVVHHGGIIDTCGKNGHRRSTDGGGQWAGAQPGGLPLPGGTCSIAASPDESSVLFATVGTKIFETDNGGGSWDTEFVNPSAQGHVPFVATNKRQGRNFDLWFGDKLLHRAACLTPVTRSRGARCPPSSTWTLTAIGAHPDMGNVVFTDPHFNVTACRRDCSNAETSCRNSCAEFLDSCISKVGQPGEPSASQCNEAASRCRAKCTSDLNACNANCNRPQEGCPFVLSNDGGTFINTLTKTPACQTPKWIESQVTTRGLWLWTLTGADIPNSIIGEALYMGAQDNGPFATLNAGAATPNWLHRVNGDSFDAAADSTQVVHSNCCFGTKLRDNQVFRRNPGMIGGGQIPNYPPGVVPRFFFPDVIARFGPNRYAIIMSTGIYATLDINGDPIPWTHLGTNAPTNACGLWAAGPPSSPTFFAITGFCSGFFGDLLRYNGTSERLTWEKVPLPPGSLGVGVFAVDPNNPLRLFVSVFNSTGQNMFRSGNGGITWTADAALDSLMTGGGAFQLTVTNAGGVPYTQPTLVAFDPDNPNNLLAGAADAGIFLSRDNGTTWVTLTNNSGDAANPIIPRPHWAYFDRECSRYNIYVGTQGRGAWRFSYADSAGTTVSACQSRCDASFTECQSECEKLFDECMSETGPDKPLPSQCANARTTCRTICSNTRNTCRQRCVDCPQ